jgi:hypothetical protein
LSGASSLTKLVHNELSFKEISIQRGEANNLPVAMSNTKEQENKCGSFLKGEGGVEETEIVPTVCAPPESTRERREQRVEREKEMQKGGEEFNQTRRE